MTPEYEWSPDTETFEDVSYVAAGRVLGTARSTKSSDPLSEVEPDPESPLFPGC